MMDLSLLLQLVANGICTGANYAILALGFGLIYNCTKIFHFAHGSIYAAAAYIFLLLIGSLRIPPMIAVILTIIFIVIIGILSDILVYRPIERNYLSPLASMIGSFGVYLVIVNCIAIFFGNEIQLVRFEPDKVFPFGNISLTRFQILSPIVLLLIIIALFLVNKTRYGQILKAYSNDSVLIEVLGWNSSIIRIITFAIGSLLAAVAAIITAINIGFDPYIGMNGFLICAIAVIIGGVGFFEGAIIGGLLLGIVQSFVVLTTSNRWLDLFTFLILIFFLKYFPNGLLGIKIRIEEDK
jgi:branched-chain amino acid transport system permease protein